MIRTVTELKALADYELEGICRRLFNKPIKRSRSYGKSRPKRELVELLKPCLPIDNTDHVPLPFPEPEPDVGLCFTTTNTPVPQRAQWTVIKWLSECVESRSIGYGDTSETYRTKELHRWVFTSYAAARAYLNTIVKYYKEDRARYMAWNGYVNEPDTDEPLKAAEPGELKPGSFRYGIGTEGPYYWLDGPDPKDVHEVQLGPYEDAKALYEKTVEHAKALYETTVEAARVAFREKS